MSIAIQDREKREYMILTIFSGMVSNSQYRLSEDDIGIMADQSILAADMLISKMGENSQG